MTARPAENDGRVLIHLPNHKDSLRTEQMLGERGMASCLCRDLADVCRELPRGAGAVLMTEELLRRDDGRLSRTLREQPPWSAIPLVILTHEGRGQRLGPMAYPADVTLVERPVHMRTLHSVVDAALRTRQQQYQIRDLVEGLKQADRHKDQFLAMLAHELRNPLSPIRSGIDLMRMESEHAPDVLELMQHQVEHLVRLVDDLLDVSRIVQGRIELRLETIDVASIVQRSVAAVSAAIRAQKLELRLSLPADPIWLRGDPVRLMQILENLLHNASKYTPSGGQIDLVVHRDAWRVTLEVRDTGIGIDSELLPRVFELFTQAERSLDRSQGGLGIGLTLVQTLVTLHGGTVEAASDGNGRGSVFTVRLPIADPPEAPETGLGKPQSLRPVRVLAVDDNIGAATLLGRLIGHLGQHTVELAHDGPTAIAKASTFHPDLILLDIGLPRMDGFEVARVLRSRSEFAGTMLVALTGYGQDEDRRKSREAGFDEHLTKPPSLDNLRRILAHPRLQEGAAQPA